MPLFHRRSDEEKQREEGARANQAASISALEMGGIPVAAQRRIEEMRHQDRPFFTSDLGVAEFLLARQAGVRPLSQVMGSSVYHVGYQYVSGWYSSGELNVVSDALNAVRTLALGRLAQEAHLLDADVVLGVRIEMKDLGEKLLEFQAFGTAAKVEGAPPSEGPALTTLSGQDFWKLYTSGYWPVGVAAGSTVYHAVPSWGAQWSMSSFGSWYNQELTDFTAGLYAARQLAMRRIRQQGQELRAAGIVGVEIRQSEEEYEVHLGNDQDRTDMIFTFHVLGTCIAEIGGSPTPPPIYSSLDLRA